MKKGLIEIIPLFIPFVLYWVILSVDIPTALSRFFHNITWTLFFVLLIFYCFSLKLPDRFGRVIFLCLVVSAFALSLSYKWSSAYSDNFVIGGMLPYKDGKNYYFGAELILNGSAPVKANQATERPLFPGFLSSLLFLTGNNLMLSLAILTLLIGIGVYLATKAVHQRFGAFSAGTFGALLSIYALPLAGYTMSETIGFTLGCLSFSLLWRAAYRVNKADLLVGFLSLLVGVSARAGTFFIFPMLALWIGWIFRSGKKFSITSAILSLFLVLIGYSIVNPVYAWSLGIPPGNSFGNFSYTLYGQVTGGTGWSSAINELGTRNPSIVYRESLKFFLAHPLSIMIGFAKTYRDFFFLGETGIFYFGGYRPVSLIGIVLWLGMFSLMILGLSLLLRNFQSSLSSFLIACFVGILISIAFLPPIDGGTRFYAATVPYFYIVPALGLNRFTKNTDYFVKLNERSQPLSLALSILLGAIIVLIIVVPPIIKSTSQKPILSTPDCPVQQEPYVILVHPDSYINFVKGETIQCGLVPDVCMSEFEENNNEMATDDFYLTIQELMLRVNIRAGMVPAINLMDDRFHYFFFPDVELPENKPDQMISGCAVEITTLFQSIYQVETSDYQLK